MFQDVPLSQRPVVDPKDEVEYHTNYDYETQPHPKITENKFKKFYH